MRFIAGIILILGVLSPGFSNARPISDDIEELNLKYDVALAEIGENGAANFQFQIINGKEGKTEWVIGRITHLPSGLVCDFNPDEELYLKAFSTDNAGIIKDYSCNIEGYGYSKTLYAYAKNSGIEDQLVAAKIAIEYRFDGAIPYEIPSSDFINSKAKIDYAQSPYLLSTKYAAYDININGSDKTTSVWIYPSGDWFFKMRVTSDKTKLKDYIATWNDILTLSGGAK